MGVDFFEKFFSNRSIYLSCFQVPAHEPEAAVADAHWQVDDRDGAWAVFQTGKFCPKNWDFGA